jgi:hypothetical protein
MPSLLPLSLSLEDCFMVSDEDDDIGCCSVLDWLTDSLLSPFGWHALTPIAATVASTTSVHVICRVISTSLRVVDVVRFEPAPREKFVRERA